MKKCYYAICWSLCFLLAGNLSAQISDDKINTTDLTKINQLGAVYMAPDGKKAVYTVTAIEPDPENKDEYKYSTHLYLTDLTPGHAPLTLTRGPESARQPDWSPDSRAIVFVRGVRGVPQLFVLPLAGGEPYQLTRLKYGASSPKWSPDGAKILFLLVCPFPLCRKIHY